jgi:hypothetical protein
MGRGHFGSETPIAAGEEEWCVGLRIGEIRAVPITSETPMMSGTGEGSPGHQGFFSFL